MPTWSMTSRVAAPSAASVKRTTEYTPGSLLDRHAVNLRLGPTRCRLCRIDERRPLETDILFCSRSIRPAGHRHADSADSVRPSPTVIDRSYGRSVRVMRWRMAIAVMLL